MNQEFNITIFTENTVGVLNRITNIFTRRKINIESLKVAETEHKGISMFSIVAYSDAETMQIVRKNIERIVEVLKADINNPNMTVEQVLSEIN